MEITIKNFANIKSLQIEIENNKLNFIYGISGSGKSSFSKALTLNDEEICKYTTFGVSDVANISRNTYDTYEIFNEDSINEFIFAKSGKGVYDVLYGENEQIKEVKNKLNTYLSNNTVLDIRNIISNQSEKITVLVSDLNLKYTTKGSISKTGFYKVLDKAQDYEIVREDLDAKHKSWIRDGYEYIGDNECPFCSQSMGTEIIERINKINNELPSEFDKLISINEKLAGLGIKFNIEKIYEKSAQEELKKAIDREFSILKELKEIESVLNTSFLNDNELQNEKRVEVSLELDELFNQYDINIKSFINQLYGSKESYIKLKKKYNSMLQTLIKGNIKKLNECIKYFGIKYQFVKQNFLDKKESYQLRHINADKDTSEYLSTGEKNILSLVLFLFSNMMKDLIIDDPVSSYDEYRREQILNFIINYRYKNIENRKTTIILSHDQIFLKFLSRIAKNNNTCDVIGVVYHLENINNDCTVSKIECDDIDTIFNHIKNRCSTVNDYALKVLNLRLLYELQDRNSIEYKYLSAILHSKKNCMTSMQLEDLLVNSGTNEESVINKIKSNTGIVLDEFNVDKLEINFNELTKFELMCFAREEINGEDKKELNNVIHFNYSLFHILNPYKFNFQSEKCYSIIDDWLKQKTNREL